MEVGEKECPYCAETIKEKAVYCRYCHRDLPSSELCNRETDIIDENNKCNHVQVDKVVVDTSNYYYFPVSTKKLVVMSVVTFNLYLIHWFYNNWYLVKEREKTNIWPLIRGILSVIFCYSLLKRIKQSALEHNIPYDANPAWQAFFFILLVGLPSILVKIWFVSLFTFLILIHIQNVNNSINEKLFPHSNKNDKFSFANIIAIVLGGGVLLLSLIGTFVG